MNVVYCTFVYTFILFSIKVANANDSMLKETDLVYNRNACHSLGDQLGELLHLAILARMDKVKIHYEWCSGTENTVLKIQDFHTNQSSWLVEEFLVQFPMPHEVSINKKFSSHHSEHPHRVKFNKFEIPSEIGFNHLYTTAFRTTRVKNENAADPEKYLTHYRQISTPIVDIARTKHKFDSPYIVLHMNAVDHKPFHGTHDDITTFCTIDILNKVKKNINAKFFMISNNISWMKDLLGKNLIENVKDTSEYDQLQYMLGASAIIQHAIYGWSSFSSVPAMMANIPIMTTYSSRMHLH